MSSMTIVLIISVAVNLALGYVVYNLYYKLNVVENEFVKDTNIINKTLIAYENMLKLIIRCQTEMDLIDKRGSFSSDDEVGIVFKLIKVAIDNLVTDFKKLKDSYGEAGQQ